MVPVEILSNVNGWLKHAEAKHAVLIGLTAAGVTSIANNIPKIWSFGLAYGLCAVLALVSFSAAVVVSLVSFLPILNPPEAKTSRPRTHDGNPYFFADIARMSTHEFYSVIHPSNAPSSESDLWIAEQIVANARIAMRKYKLFTAALWLVLVGVCAPLAIVFATVKLAGRRRAHAN